MFTYITIGINDLPRAVRFYDPVLATLGFERRQMDDQEAGYAAAGDSRCRFWITHPFDGKPATIGNVLHIKPASSRQESVEMFLLAKGFKGRKGASSLDVDEQGFPRDPREDIPAEEDLD